MFIYNDSKLKSRRKELRKLQTIEEKIIWNKLRAKASGAKFFRQYSVGPYILDFYCPTKRLAIELDGEHHRGDKDYDRMRDEYLNLNDIRVMRFWNREINDNMDYVLEKIVKEITSS